MIKVKEQLYHFLNARIFLLLIAVVCSVVQSCSPPEPFSNTPRIYFTNLEFKEDDRNGFQDSLILYFDFEDGDGDLGIQSNEITPPYNDFSIIVDSVSSISGSFPNSYRFVTYGATSIYPPFYSINPYTGEIDSLYSQEDSRPSFSCEYYDTLRINSTKTRYIDQTQPGNFPGFVSDTVMLNKNPRRFNMLVDYYIDIQGDGNFELFDWNYATSEYGCGQNFYGRYPIWDADNIGTSLQGTIKYSMLSLGFKNILRTREFKLKFWITDRANNVSNVVETEVFTLTELQRRQSGQE